MSRASRILDLAKVLPTATGTVLLLVPQTKEALSALLSLTAQDIALLVLLLFAATVSILLSSSTPRSAIPSPGTFLSLLRSLRKQQLEPYATTAGLVVHECLRQQQVYVVGPAGVGKSTLVEHLLAVELMSSGAILPVYVRQLDDANANVDERSLSVAARTALQRAGLPDTFLSQGDNDSVFDLLDRLAAAKRVPILLFDHFDDYLAANLHWLSSFDVVGVSEAAVSVPRQASDIRQQSAFWDRIASRVTNNTLKTVYVTTPDLIAFVSCFRFGTRVVQCPVFELPVAAAGAYVSHLEGELASQSRPITLPGDGWNLLTRRVLADLAPRQTCLPHQLNLMLQGIAHLPYATPEAYRSNDGLQGLGALAVDVMAQEIASTEVGTNGTQAWLPEYVLGVCAALSVLAVGSGSVERVVVCAAELAPAGLPRPWPESADPRWQLTLQRLSARRLVRLRRLTDSGPEVYELRHPYVGSAAKAALVRKAPVEANLARQANVHAAAATWVDWWRTLLPTRQLIRLVWARQTTPFRFGVRRRYAVESLARLTLWASAGMTYVLLADAGLALPLGDGARKAIDNFGFTFFRQALEPAKSVAELRRVRDRLGEIIVTRCQATKWCLSADGFSQANEETWSTSQALAAVIGFPEGKAIERAWLVDSLDVMFSTRHKLVDGAQKVGWTLGALSDCAVAEPALWMGIALARAQGSSGRSAPLSDRLPKWSKEVAQAVDSFARGAPAAPAPFIEFVARSDANKGAPPSVYAASLSLLRDVERAAYEPSVRQRIEATVKWILENKRARSSVDPADGWQAAVAPGQAISPGVTMQVIYGLLRARSIVPNAVPDEVQTLALKWLNSFETEENPFLESVSFYYGDCTGSGNPRTYGHVVRFLWYPWALGVSLELHQAQGGEMSRGERLVVARALDHFRKLATSGFPSNELDKQPTYKLSEFVYTMASAR